MHTLPKSVEFHFHCPRYTTTAAVMLIEALLFGCALSADSGGHRLTGFALHNDRESNFCLDDSPEC